jgi:hypothetical protein
MTARAVPARNESAVLKSSGVLARALAAAAPALVALSAAADAVAQPPDAAVERARGRLEARLGPGMTLRADPRSGTVRSLGRLDGPLAPAAAGPPGRSALDFVRANHTALGLGEADVDTLAQTRRVDAAGLTQVTFGQRIDGLPAARATLRATFDSAGRLRTLAGILLPDLALDTTTPAIGAAEAYRRIRGGAPAIASRDGGAERATRFRDGGGASLVAARADGRDRLAWRVLAPVDSRHFLDALVDAADGGVIARFNRVRNAGQIARFRYNPDAAGQQTITAPAGWFSATPAAGDPLSGPNAHAVLDVDDLIEVRPPDYAESSPTVADPAPADAQGNWVKPLLADVDGSTWDPSTPGSWADNANQSAAQLFWFVNNFHDHLAAAPISFDAASGNFQGTDPIVAQAMDGANGPGGGPDNEHTSNANMLTLPDGRNGYMQTYLFDAIFGLPFATVDSANDATIVYHEYGHGLAGRLVTYSDGWDAMWSGFGGGQAGAMGEGGSDWYAVDYLVGAGLMSDTAAENDVRLGEYVSPGGGTAMRFEGVDCRVGGSCPGTGDAGPGGFDFSDYGHVDSSAEVHSDGEIWAQTLWDVRSALATAHGSADGVSRARRYVTGGLRLAPPEPTFPEMRDAIIQAAALFDPGDVDRLWQTFAARGLGWSATVGGPGGAGFDMPPFVATGAATGVGQTTAKLSGTIDPHGLATSYRFEYGITTGYGVSTATTPIGSGSSPVPVSASLTGLEPGTTYHYRVLAVRGTRTQAGADRTFKTAAISSPPPVIGPPQTVTPTPTTLKGGLLRADRRGRFQARVSFGSDAPLGRARLDVKRRGKLVASKLVDVVRSRTITVPLRLNSKGRRLVRRHSRKAVTLVLRLPSGARVRKNASISRR